MTTTDVQIFLIGLAFLVGVWLFTRRRKSGGKVPPPAPWPEPKPCPIVALTEKTFNAFPVGICFPYLGRTLQVAKHKHYIPGLMGGYHMPSMPTTWPRLICRYTDDRGQIHELEFAFGEFSQLLSMKGPE